MGYCDKTPNVKDELSARDDVLIKDRCRTRSVAASYFRDGLVQDFTSDGVNLTITLKDGSTKTTTVEGVIAGTFEDGLTVTSNTDVVVWSTGGDQSGNYNWTGEIPEGGLVVPPGSTPETTGGIAPGAWAFIGPSLSFIEDTLRAQGYNPVGSWPESGQPDATLSNKLDVLLYTDNVYYHGNGPFPQTVSSTTIPTFPAFSAAGNDRVVSSVDVREFGASPLAADNSAAIIDALNSGAKTVTGGDLQYRCASPIIQTAAANVRNIELQYTGLMTLAFYTVSGSANSTMDDTVVIDANQLAYRGLQVSNSPCFRSGGVLVKNAYADDSLGGSGVDRWAIGVAVVGSSDDVDLTNLKVERVDAIWDGTEVESDGSTARGVLVAVAGSVPMRPKIHGVRVKGITGSSGVGIQVLSGATPFPAMEFDISGCSVWGVTNRAYKIQASNGSIVGNRHFLGQEYIQDFLDTHSLTSISDFFNAKANIESVDSSNVLCSNNLLIAEGYQTTLLLSGGSDVLASDNLTRNNTAGSGVQSCIGASGSSRTIIKGGIAAGGDRGTWLLGSTSNSKVEGVMYSAQDAQCVRVEGNDNMIKDNVAMECPGVTAIITVVGDGNEVSANTSLEDNKNVVSILSGSGNVAYDNLCQTTNVDVVSWASQAVRDVNPAWLNGRFNAHREFNSATLNYGRYDLGDAVRVETGTPGEYLFRVVRFGGEYGTGTVPVLVNAAEIV